MAVPVPLAVSDRFPYLSVVVRVRGRTHQVEALFDTGFSGYVVLPTGTINSGAPPDSYYFWTVADGREVQAPIYVGTVQIGDAPTIEALITVLGDESIVGRQLTDRFRVTLDHGKRLIIEP